MSTKLFKWGIMGCGNIAAQFAASLQSVRGLFYMQLHSGHMKRPANLEQNTMR